MLQLSKRLLAVAGLVGSAKILADVGTDHGYIPVHLLACGKIQRAVAMDINPGPLGRAEQNICQYGMTGRIETRISDGLSSLLPGEADTIVIAGMGGKLMMRILSQGEDTARAAKRLVLQPQSELYAFRCFLLEHGYKAVAEDIVYEDGKYYSMMAVENSMDADGYCTQREITEISLKYGSLLIRQRHPVLQQYLQYQKGQKEKILNRLDSHARQDVSQRKVQVRQELKEIEDLLKMWKEQEV